MPTMPTMLLPPAAHESIGQLYEARVSGTVPPGVLTELDEVRAVEQEMTTVLRIRLAAGAALARRLSSLRARGIQLLDVRRTTSAASRPPEPGADR